MGLILCSHTITTFGNDCTEHLRQPSSSSHLSIGLASMSRSVRTRGLFPTIQIRSASNDGGVGSDAQPGSPRGRCAIKPRSAGDFYVRPQGGIIRDQQTCRSNHLVHSGTYFVFMRQHSRRSHVHASSTPEHGSKRQLPQAR